MAQGVVADNWSLQDISTLLNDGLEDGLAGEIVIGNDDHRYQGVRSAIIQTEALFDFLIDLLLRDEILVEIQHTSAWEKQNSPLIVARDSGVIRAFDFMKDYKKIEGPRDIIVERLCRTDSLKIAHEENVRGWSLHKRAPDPLLSATLWGGAGMCARSFVYEKSYTPHPLRKRLFLNTGFMLPSDDAVHQLSAFVNDQKVKVSKKIYGNESIYSSYVNIPAIPLRVIQEASTPDQLIFVALQMRDHFKDLRDWLKKFQNAMASDDTSELLKYREQLDSVRNYVNKKIGSKSASNGPLTMEAGVGIFKISHKDISADSFKNQFGVRASINRLIFGGGGKPAIKKYLKMFEAGDTEIGYEIESHFTTS